MRFVEVTKGYIVDVTKIRIIKCAADKTHNDGRTVQNNLMHIHMSGSKHPLSITFQTGTAKWAAYDRLSAALIPKKTED